MSHLRFYRVGRKLLRFHHVNNSKMYIDNDLSFMTWIFSVSVVGYANLCKVFFFMVFFNTPLNKRTLFDQTLTNRKVVWSFNNPQFFLFSKTTFLKECHNTRPCLLWHTLPWWSTVWKFSSWRFMFIFAVFPQRLAVRVVCLLMFALWRVCCWRLSNGFLSCERCLAVMSDCSLVFWLDNCFSTLHFHSFTLLIWLK